MEDKRYYRCSEVSSYGVKMGFVDMRALGEAVGGGSEPEYCKEDRRRRPGTLGSGEWHPELALRL